MLLTVFAKKRTTKDGKPFYTHVTKLTKKDGTEVYATVKFSDGLESPKPDACPCNIEVDKAHANLTHKVETGDDGNVYERNTLWVKDYEFSKIKYVDNSLDDFE